MPRVRRPKVTWPSWRYGPNGASSIFQCEEDVPFGWYAKPIEEQELATVAPLVLDHNELVSKLESLGIEVDPTWGLAHLKKVLDDSRTAR